MVYTTMTVGGIYGSRFNADTDAEASKIVTEFGYKVLDIIDGTESANADAIVVVE